MGNVRFVVQETSIPRKTRKANTVEFTVQYCNLYLLHLISEKIWLLLHSFVILALEQRHLQ